MVVGGGLAGVAAALAAAATEARVLLVDKQSDLGGSTVLSGGFVALADTGLQRRLGIDDSPQRLLADLLATGGGYADEALLRRYVEDGPALHDWFASRVPFSTVHLGAGQTAARSHVGDIVELFTRLAAELAAHRSVTVCTGEPVHRLVRSPASAGGRVVGVRLGSGAEVRARGGVVLTSGGFARSEVLMRTFAPGQARATRLGATGNTGDGLRMGQDLGADLRDMGQVKGTFGHHPGPTDRPHELLLAFYLGAIVVNGRARRFVDESSSYKLLGDACLAQPDGPCFQVFDAAVARRSSAGVPLYDVDEVRRRGQLLTADSWAELAAATGLDPAALAATVERYNAGVDAGVDEFGRRGCSQGAGELVALREPPFHAFASTSAVLATYCGLRVDPDARVIDVFGEPVPGLWAAGEVTGGFHGQAYMTGSSLGKAALFGRVAGDAASRETALDPVAAAGDGVTPAVAS